MMVRQVGESYIDSFMVSISLGGRDEPFVYELARLRKFGTIFLRTEKVQEKYEANFSRLHELYCLATLL